MTCSPRRAHTPHRHSGCQCHGGTRLKELPIESSLSLLACIRVVLRASCLSRSAQRYLRTSLMAREEPCDRCGSRSASGLLADDAAAKSPRSSRKGHCSDRVICRSIEEAAPALPQAPLACATRLADVTTRKPWRRAWPTRSSRRATRVLCRCCAARGHRGVL